MLSLFLGVGIFFTIKCGLFQIRHFTYILKKTIFSSRAKKTSAGKGGISQFQALTTALAATMGTGNIVAVATAITLGGAGSIFWMWVSAILGMMTGFAENVLGIYYRRKNKDGTWTGGPMPYIEKAFGTAIPAKMFALFCIGASFGMGNMSQSNSIAGALTSSLSIPPILTGLIVGSILLLVIVGGISRIGKVTEMLIPIMSVLYMIGVGIIIAFNVNKVPYVLGKIISDAFSFRAVGGGIGGTMIYRGIKYGIRRGVFSNEAGLGSSVIVHCATNAREPVTQGMWAIFEVFFDTIIICTLTALSILLTGVADCGAQGSALVIEAFKTCFGGYGVHFISVSITFFGFATLVGWSFYGESCTKYVFGDKGAKYYKYIYVVIAVIGAITSLEFVWEVSDTFNALMALPNLIAILLLSGTVIKISRNYNQRYFKGKSSIKPMLSAHTKIQAEQESRPPE